MSDPVLYIFMRTDMDSLNSGKAMAQAAHAANQMVLRVRSIKEKARLTGGGSYVKHLLNEWEKQGSGFGTTIVLNGDDLQYAKLGIAQMEKDKELKPWYHGSILDETYPIKDGRITHLLPIETCLWIFADKDDPKLTFYIEKFSLHD